MIDESLLYNLAIFLEVIFWVSEAANRFQMSMKLTGFWYIHAAVFDQRFFSKMYLKQLSVFIPGRPDIERPVIFFEVLPGISLALLGQYKEDMVVMRFEVLHDIS